MFDKLKRRFRRMDKLRIDEISCVDKPAQEPATVRIIKRHDPGSFTRAHTEGLANRVASIFSDAAITDKNAALSRAYAEFEKALIADAEKRVGDERPRRDSFIDHAHGPAHYRLLSRFFDIKQKKPNQLPEASYQEAWTSISEADSNELRRADAIPNDDLDLTEKGLKDMDNSSLGAIIKQFGFEKFAKHVAENGASISEAEFVAAGNAHYGKDAFTKMIATDATIYAACRKLNDTAIAKFDARWFPNGSGTAEKVGYGGGELASLEPITRTGTGRRDDELADDFRAMVEREMATAPWLSVKEAEARCNYAIRAKEEANKKRRANASA